jgi:hypothetical protein
LKEDGKFFMPFKQFMKYFHDYQICYFHDNYLYSSQRYSSTKNKPTYLEFKVTKPGEYYFSINQINKRFFRRSDSKKYTFGAFLTEFRLQIHPHYFSGWQEVFHWERNQTRGHGQKE